MVELLQNGPDQKQLSTSKTACKKGQNLWKLGLLGLEDGAFRGNSVLIWGGYAWRFLGDGPPGCDRADGDHCSPEPATWIDAARDRYPY